MPAGEFAVIDRYFLPLGAPGGKARADVIHGVGDDAAVVRVPAGQELVVAVDTLVSGRHFLADSSPAAIGHRALAVNLSDLAAMGATPAWALLALTLPSADEAFLADFARGFGALAAAHGVALIGGDTTAGPLTLSVQIMGLVPQGCALLRSGGACGDLVFVSGSPGEAAAGLLFERGAERGGLAGVPGREGPENTLRHRLLFPTPRVRLGELLRGLATACIDVSDGLAQDAGKLAALSGCGLRLEADELPLSAALQACVGTEQALQLALAGGDDYELCFTVAPQRLAELPALLEQAQCGATCIGVLEPLPGTRVMRGGVALPTVPAGYDHFAG